MFENTENQFIATGATTQEKNQKQCKSKSTALQPSPPNSEKRALKRLGPYEFSIDQKIGSGMTGDAYVGMNTETF